ncbi:MAG TPA: zinc ribbon domain-containing protein [Thermoplasmata archaeon]|nr:zinc ribbon domain-containing protein [Thermoplasmata archaeon]
MRTIRRAVIERPAWRRGELRVEGPDEDPFTLAVSVAEALRRSEEFRGPFARVHLVGPTTPEVAPALGEALGDPALEVRRSEGGATEVYAALATATGSNASEGPEAVLVVDPATHRVGPDGERSSGAGAIAFGIAEGPGVRMGPHGERHHPPERRPDATSWVRTVRRGIPSDAPGKGALLVRARIAPPVLLAFWTRELPDMVLATAEPVDPSLGPAPHLGPALDIIAAAGLAAPGPSRVIATIEPARTTYVGIVAEAPLPVELPLPLPAEAPSWRGRAEGDDRRLASVSEGAYVPWPRYQESRGSRWRFVAEKCEGCGRLTFPARGVCRGCGRSDGLEPVPLPRDGGVVEARTTVRPGAQPTEFDPWVEAVGGYDVALVRLAPGVRATLAITDAPAGSTPLGAKVRTRLRRLYPMEGSWRYGRKAIVDRAPAP